MRSGAVETVPHRSEGGHGVDARNHHSEPGARRFPMERIRGLDRRRVPRRRDRGLLDRDSAEPDHRRRGRVVAEGITLGTVRPNPAGGLAMILFTLPRTTDVTLAVVRSERPPVAVAGRGCHARGIARGDVDFRDDRGRALPAWDLPGADGGRGARAHAARVAHRVRRVAGAQDALLGTSLVGEMSVGSSSTLLSPARVASLSQSTSPSCAAAMRPARSST